MNEPIGNLCVLPDGTQGDWLVAICQGGGNKLVLRRFEARDKAADWAFEERARRQTEIDTSADETGQSLCVHFADHCPCGGAGITW